MADPLNLRTLVRPSSPNTALFAPPNAELAAEVDQETPVFSVPAVELAAVARDTFGSMKRVEVEDVSPDGMKLHFIAKTALLRFKDDIHIEIVPVGDDGSSLIIYSASRVGHSDLGTNKKRVTEWLDVLQTRVKGS